MSFCGPAGTLEILFAQSERRDRQARELAASELTDTDNDWLDDSGEDEPEITEADLARRLSVSELCTIKLAVPASSVQIVLKTFSCTCTFGLVSPAKKAERYSCASRPYNRTISIDRYLNADNGTSELQPKGIISPATIISHA